MYGNPWSTEIKRPFESKHIAQFGLDLNDNRKLSESFKSPFYKYYNDSKVDDLKTMDFSKIFAEHDETLLYIFYNMSDEEIKAKSSKELAKKGWKLDSDTQAWTTTREVSSKGGKSNGVTRQSSKSKSKNRRKEENEKDIQRWKFDIQKWNLLPQKSSGNG
mmetsp:Transcript_3750/g.3481  ORF Transcript_3750/g.3481 Transcript_3750/m.3481 type:complete len:161 (-) Transcript_3750:219-701(-)|eukprot:CAMPEP_0196998956 /NCGR_PEP_ID=MMETSP1380-20130617/4233_1 /TAXON_ID=5936 /ORGANISM="Euplotes crassus, Strain CT5" /LENGTH=160 /DNA_ID=CAMNT_0042415709 /DNA_START=486 /DNA_END=968 /DNA_ORIENTATION=-